MTETDFCLYPRLADEVRGLDAFSGGGRPFLRLSRPKDALFVTDLPLRVPPEALARFRLQAAALGWSLKETGGILALTPTLRLYLRLETPPLPPAEGEGEAWDLLRLMERYCVPAPPDPRFSLTLLRAVGFARLGKSHQALIPDLKSAYALGLRRHDAVRTALTCVLMREVCVVLDRKEKQP